MCDKTLLDFALLNINVRSKEMLQLHTLASEIIQSWEQYLDARKDTNEKAKWTESISVPPWSVIFCNSISAS